MYAKYNCQQNFFQNMVVGIQKPSVFGQLWTVNTTNSITAVYFNILKIIKLLKMNEINYPMSSAIATNNAPAI